MASHELIDAQFDRAVEIVQSLPKTGPIQTDYEEKLLMYSLFKQATVGNVQSARPAMWDMLGRAKWDAWAKHKDLDPYEARWLYVEALLKVLRRYSDKTIAMNLVRELESYGGDPSNLVMSRSFTKSPGSDASGSTVSDDPAPFPRLGAHATPRTEPEENDSDSSSEEEDSGDEVREFPSTHINAGRASTDLRPQSSMSSQRYRTPLAGSLLASSPPLTHLPQEQPLPGFETPSAFGETTPSIPSAPGYPQDTSLSSPYNDSFRHETSTPHAYADYPNYRSQMQSRPVPLRPNSTVALERAVENVQSHLAALQERLETLEARSVLHSRTNLAGSPRGSHSPSYSRLLYDRTGGGLTWDIDDLGMWSFVLNPLSRGIDWLRTIGTFFAKSEDRSPSMIVVRRLCLDVSFLICVVALIGSIWRKSGVRRREVKAALIVLWRAIVGSRPPRTLIEQGV